VGGTEGRRQGTIGGLGSELILWRRERGKKPPPFEKTNAHLPKKNFKGGGREGRVTAPKNLVQVALNPVAPKTSKRKKWGKGSMRKKKLKKLRVGWGVWKGVRGGGGGRWTRAARLREKRGKQRVSGNQEKVNETRHGRREKVIFGKSYQQRCQKGGNSESGRESAEKALAI